MLSLLSLTEFFVFPDSHFSEMSWKTETLVEPLSHPLITLYHTCYEFLYVLVMNFLNWQINLKELEKVSFKMKPSNMPIPWILFKLSWKIFWCLLQGGGGGGVVPNMIYNMKEESDQKFNHVPDHTLFCARFILDLPQVVFLCAVWKKWESLKLHPSPLVDSILTIFMHHPTRWYRTVSTYCTFLCFSIFLHCLCEFHWFSYQHCHPLMWKNKHCIHEWE